MSDKALTYNQGADLLEVLISSAMPYGWKQEWVARVCAMTNQPIEEPPLKKLIRRRLGLEGQS